MMKLFIRPALFLLFLSILATTCNAYWLESQPEPFTMHGEREQAPPSSRKGIFTVQDNFNLFTLQDEGRPILLSASDYFIAADVINANLPVFGIFSHPVKMTGDPIASLIYANLKLKKLIDDYKILQKKAQKLLSSSYSHIPAVKMQFSASIPIHQELQQLSTKLFTIKPSGLPSKTAPNQSPVTPSPSDKLIVTLHNIGTRHENRQQPTRMAVNNAIKTSRTYSTSNNRANHNHTSPSTPPKEAQDHNSYSASTESTIQTIMEIPLKICQYILDHKFTSLLIFFFTVMIIKSILGTN